MTPWFPGEACSSGITSGGPINVTTTNAQGGGTMVATLHAGIDGINAFGVIFRYQSATIAVTSAPESVIMPTSLPTASTPSTTSTALGATSHNTGRNIGIGVGVSLGSIGILSIIFAIWFVRRRSCPSHEVSKLQASKLYPVQEMPVVEEPVNRSELGKNGRQPRTGINLGQDSRIIGLTFVCCRIKSQWQPLLKMKFQLLPQARFVFRSSCPRVIQ
jgi:hypothetical protein